MDSKRNTRLPVVAFAAAILLSAAAFYFGAGLYPRWWLMWVAALPLLLLAPRLSWGWALVMVLVARVLGALPMWNYIARLRMPLWVRLEVVLAPAVVLGLAVLLFRSFFRRGRVWLAVLAFPSLIVVFEFGWDRAFGTFGNTAYTQLNDLPVLQLAAVTGMWGVGFVVLLFAPAVAAILLCEGAMRRRVAFMIGAVVVCVVGFGVWRMRSAPPAPHTITIGLVSTQFPSNIFPSSDSQKLQLLNQYAAQASALAARGAKIVVLPEMSVLVSGSLSEETDHLFEQTGREANAQILLGVLHVTSHAAFNEARLYSSSGQLEAVYRKRHLVPVLEGRTTPVRDLSVLHQPDGPMGLAICRDLDYPNPARQYGKNKVGLLLVPAWDFDIDRFWHGHMAIMRGVEYGYSIVRSAKVGYLTVSDDRGRVLAQAGATPSSPFTTLLARVPVRHDPTPYVQFGDWFAWLNAALLCGLVALWFQKRSSSGLAPSDAAIRDESVPQTLS
ncbi:MAG: hypothetical protein KGM47_04280 [Acidobacteriota bacterium]|nr:hypothetical protein [Acidobacteriota bacterium]